MAHWQEEGWKEAPVPVWNLLNYAALQEGRNGLAVFSEGLREFEVLGEERKTFALTLLRGVGLLGKEDLLLRPGRPSGIKMRVPDSQMRGALHGRFSLFSYSGSPLSVGLAQQARSWLTPIQCYNKIPRDAMKLNKAGVTSPTSFSLLSMSPVGCQLSALKNRRTATNSSCVCITLQNPLAVKRQCRLAVKWCSVGKRVWTKCRTPNRRIRRGLLVYSVGAIADL